MRQDRFNKIKDTLVSYFSLTDYIIPQEEAEAAIREGISFRGTNILILIFAILIASLVFFRFDFLLSTQLLWLNLITDSFPVLALGMEKEDADIMNRPPVRAEKSLFSKSSIASIAFFGLYITALTIGVYAVGLKLYGNEVATALTFLTISFTELFHAFNIRSERQSIFRCGLFSNKILLATVALGILVNVLLAISPFAGAFGLVSLGWQHWLVALGLAVSVIPVGEIYKLVLRAATRRKKASPKGEAQIMKG